MAPAAPKTPRKKTRKATKRGVKANGDMASQFYQQGRDAVTGSYDSAVKAGRSFPQMAKSLRRSTRDQSFYTMLEERPLVLGAVGLGVGMVVAAILPSMTSHRGR
jgi:hypothetical protein